MIACIAIPYFAAAVERRRDGRLRPMPLILGGQPWEARPLYAFSREVARRGVKAGMSLRLAHLLAPDARFLPAAELAYGAAAAEIVDVAFDFSSRVAPLPLWHAFAAPGQALTVDGRFLPLRCLLDLADLPAAECMPLARQLGRALRRQTHLAPAVGLARTRFAAQVAAGLCRPNHVLPVPPGTEAAFLAPRSVRFLPLERETARRLRLLGIRTLGQLAALPLPALREQLGAAAEPLYWLARGQADAPAPGMPPVERLAYDFEPPPANPHTLLALVHRAAAELAQRLRETEQQARALTLAWETVLGERHERQLTLQQPTAVARQLRHGFGELLAQAAPDAGRMALSVGMVAQAQADRPPWHALAVRYGRVRFLQPVLTTPDHPLPERRFQLHPLPNDAIVA
ncbi:MAG: hypothetical protein KC425_24500 [Anaerolineales bacterium]|nr:hypothetical protein [Anaerolineales bacterium]